MAVLLSRMYELMGGDGVALYSYCRQNANRDASVKAGIKEWVPSLHRITRKDLRPDKPVYVPNGTFKEDGTPNYSIKMETKARAPLAIQKYIINQKAGFARGNGVILKPSEEDSDLFQRVYRNWYDNKTDFHLTEIFRRIMAETQCAVIFYTNDERDSVDDFRFKFKIVSPLLGDKLEPIYDEDTDDLVAFGREYKRGDKTRYDLYLINEQRNVEIRRYENGKPRLVPITVQMPDINGVMVDVEDIGYDVIEQPYTKLPIVLGEQDLPECFDTKELIDEFEKGFNDFLDQMGYSADPILFAKGSTLDLPAKSQAGKYIESPDGQADLKFVTPDNATESREMQFKYLREFIMTLNQAVWLDIDTMKNLGATSGAALERYLLVAYMEATGKQQGYLGMFVQRMVNWMLHEWRALMDGVDKDLRIDATFDKYSLRDREEDTELAMKANGGKPVVDHATSISMAGLVDDVNKTKALIDAEQPTPSTTEQ